MRIKSDSIAIVALTIVLGLTAYPTQASKNAGGLRLSRPVEMPEAVHFSWTGGSEGTTYSIYRRPVGSATWERIQMGLQGVSGAVTVPGFTLNMSWQYEMRADIP